MDEINNKGVSRDELWVGQEEKGGAKGEWWVGSGRKG